MAKKKPDGTANGAVADPSLEPLHPQPRPDPPDQAPPTEKAQPIHQIRLRSVRAAIWQNARPDGTPWYAVTFSRSYRDEGGNWHSTDSFSGPELLILAEVARAAFTWIVQTTQGETPF
jgi:hypothetical protein